jgi:uncharacterized membrane protein
MVWIGIMLTVGIVSVSFWVMVEWRRHRRRRKRGD